jgi:hypothetical protein
MTLRWSTAPPDATEVTALLFLGDTKKTVEMGKLPYSNGSSATSGT